jgi:DNA polymerase phi
MARKAASSDFSALCSACSLFLSRAIESAHPTSTVVVDSYRETLEDLMTRKASLVHPSFILDLLRRFPVRAWPLRVNLITHLAPGKGVNVYRQVQAYGMLQVLAQQLPAVAKSVSGIEVESFVSSASKAVYATLGHAASDCRAEWKADRLKDVCKFALALARSSKSVLGDDKALSTWDMTKLQPAQEALVKGERTEGMKGVIGLVGQVFSTLGGSTGKTARAGKRKKAAEMGGAEDDKMDVDEPAAIAASNDAGEEVKKLKQAKTGEKKAAAEKESAVKTKRSKVKEGGKPSKKVNALS